MTLVVKLPMALLALLLAGSAACYSDRCDGGDAALDDSGESVPSICMSTYDSPTAIALAEEPLVAEVSGLVASHQTPGIFWLHNDSGDGAVAYAFMSDGSFKGYLELVGADPVDIEDIAWARCPFDASRECLWLADVGDNDLVRESLGVFVVPEPQFENGLAEEGEPFSLQTEFYEYYTLRVEGPDANIEAFVVSADGMQLFAFEKVSGTPARYFGAHLNLDASVETVLSELGELSVPGLNMDWGHAITGADFHPSGDRLLLRIYTVVLEYRLNSPFLLNDLSSLEPDEVFWGPLDEAQGEAIAYGGDGLSIWTISEDPDGLANQSLHVYGCED